MTSNPIIFEKVSHCIINNTIFWKCIMRSFRWMYANCFNRLGFSAEVSTKLQKKMHFFRQFKGHNSSRKYENWTNKPMISQIGGQSPLWRDIIWETTLHSFYMQHFYKQHHTENWFEKIAVSRIKELKEKHCKWKTCWVKGIIAAKYMH